VVSSVFQASSVSTSTDREHPLIETLAMGPEVKTHNTSQPHQRNKTTRAYSSCDLILKQLCRYIFYDGGFSMTLRMYVYMYSRHVTSRHVKQYIHTDVTWRDVTSRLYVCMFNPHVMWRDVMSRYTTLLHVTSLYVTSSILRFTSPQVTSRPSLHFTSLHLYSHEVTWRDVKWSEVMSHHFTSLDFTALHFHSLSL